MSSTGMTSRSELTSQTSGETRTLYPSQPPTTAASTMAMGMGLGGTPALERMGSFTVPPWRGFGGAEPTVSTVEYDKQLDKASVWLEKWTHDERCAVLEKLLAETKDSQCRFLWTVIQPSMHRDFMYTAKKEFPSQKFAPISTHTSREYKRKMILMHQTNYHRIQSAHLQATDHVKDVVSSLKLPDINTSFQSLQSSKISETPRNWKSKHKPNKKTVSFPKMYRSSSTLCLPQLIHEDKEGLNPAAMFDGQANSSLQHIKTAPPTFRFIELPVRRHIQDEKMEADNAKISSESLEKPIVDGLLHKRSLSFISLVNQSNIPPEGCLLIDWYSQLWTDAQRNEFLHKSLLKLDPRQHYFISSFLAIKQYRDFIDLLPEKLALKTLTYLKPRRIVICSRVSRKWFRLCNSNELWKTKCAQINLEIPIIDVKPDWKKMFRENLNVKRNWSNGKCNVVDCNGHEDKVLCATFNSQKMATGSADKTIKIWDLRDGRCIQTLRGHLKGVWYLKYFTSTLLISGSYDTTIKVWNLRDNKCTRTLIGHEGPVWAIVRRGNLLVSASQDTTARIWDISRCLLLHILSGHSEAVFTCDMDEEGKTAITGAADRTVRMWDAASGKQLKLLVPSLTTSIMSVSYSAGFMACAFGKTIVLYKFSPNEKTKLIRTLNGHGNRIETVQLRIKNAKRQEGIMISAGKDGTIKYWDLSKSESLHTYKGHERGINCVYFDETRIASASTDNRVKIWDFNINGPNGSGAKSAMTSYLQTDLGTSEAPEYRFKNFDSWE